MWDVQVGERVRKYRGHQTFVNTCNIARRGPQLLCSGSDDGTLRVSKSSLIYRQHIITTVLFHVPALMND